jgi:hypothetical protein
VQYDLGNYKKKKKKNLSISADIITKRVCAITMENLMRSCLCLGPHTLNFLNLNNWIKLG